MKLCLRCDRSFESPSLEDWVCPYCAFAPRERCGFPSFHENNDRSSDGRDGFDPKRYEVLRSVEPRSFWFRSRNEIISWAVRRFFGDARSLLEVGCGTGFVLSRLERDFPNLTLWGSEFYAEGLEFASRRLRRARLLQMDARKIPFEREMDVVGAFDVLEHIEEDENVLGAIHRALRPRGGLILTVPQHMWLWSERDVRAHHVRRYSRPDLLAKVRSAGFVVDHVTSFVSLLMPLMLASRFLQRRPRANLDGFEEFRAPAPINAGLSLVSRIEERVVRAGIDLPSGGSLLVVAHAA